MKDYKRDHYLSKEKERPQDKEKEREPNKEKDTPCYFGPFKEVKSKQVICFKCLEKGHYSFECSKKHNMILKEQDTRNIEPSSFSFREEKG